MNREGLQNDAVTAIRVAMAGNQAGLWTAMPAIVESVDLAAMTITAQPAIQGVIRDFDGSERFINLPLLLDVPICYPSAGGFSLTLPIAQGDEVLVVFSSRCIDSWWQQGGIGMPMEARMHDLSDGFAIPGPKSQPNVIGGISADNAQLRSDDGSVYIEITPDGKINLVAPSGVKVTGDVVVTGEVTANGIPLSIHVHPGVAPGSGTTGAPIP